MFNRISYKQFSEFLSEDGYTEAELKHLFKAVKSFDKEIKKWFIKWLNGGGLPSDEIEDVTISFFIDEMKLKPVNAFIIMNWLKTDPETAKYVLQREVPVLEITEELKNTAQEFLDKHAVEVSDQEDGEEDLSDLCE